MKTTCCQCLVLAAALVGSHVPLLAADAPSTVGPTATDEVIQISPFEVSASQDKGYRSVYSSGGTLVSEELRNVPSSVSVLNRELIDDIGATNIFEISRYAPGGEYNRNPTNDTQFVFRGLVNEWQTRNFFIWYLPTDSFSVDRTEIVRGPNALLYGDAQPGGLMNIVTKRAQQKDETTFKATIGSWDRYRGEIDLNRKVNSQLAIRVNGVVSRAKDFRDFRYNDFDGFQTAVTYRPFSRTQIRAELETGRVRRNNGTFLLSDQFSSFDPSVSATTGTAVRTGDTNNYYMSFDGKTIARYGSAGWRRSAGTTLSIDQYSPYYNLVPREYQFSGPTQHMNRDYNQYALTLEQTIVEGLSLEATANEQQNHNDWLRGDNNAAELRRDAQATMPDGTTNSRYGEYFVDSRYSLSRLQNFVRDYRVALTYSLKLPLGIEQRLLAFWTERTDAFEGRGFRERALANIAVDVYRRTYLKDYHSRDLSWSTIPDTTRMFGTGGTWSKSKNILDSTSTAALGSYFDGRLHTMIGYRRDTWNVKRQAILTSTVGTVTENVGFSPVVTSDPVIKDDSLSYGGVLHVLRNFHGVTVSLVGNYSESFRPTGNEFDVFGKPMLPVKGKGKEGGLRTELFDGKAVLSATFFNIDVENQRAAVAQTVRDEINTMFNAGLVSTGIGANGDTLTVNSKGYELEATLNPLPGWSLTANYSHADLSQTNVYPNIRPFWERAIQEGRALTEYQNLNTLVGNAVLQSSYVTPERNKAINVFTRYTIGSGRLKGVYFGGGANYRDRAYLGVVNNTFYFSPTSLIWNGLVGYRTKWQKRTVTVALNINNLTDRIAYTPYSFNAGQWETPREFRLSTSITF